MSKKVSILYICKRDNHCRNTCHPECHLTSEPEHAVNEACPDPENYPNRFKKSETTNYIYYVERGKDENCD